MNPTKNYWVQIQSQIQGSGSFSADLKQDNSIQVHQKYRRSERLKVSKTYNFDVGLFCLIGNQAAIKDKTILYVEHAIQMF